MTDEPRARDSTSPVDSASAARNGLPRSGTAGGGEPANPNSRRAANAGHRRAQPNLLRAGSEGGFGRETQLA
jgi:hypothetical protein